MEYEHANCTEHKVNSHSKHIDKPVIMETPLDDSRKIQIESVDSSFKDDNRISNDNKVVDRRRAREPEKVPKKNKKKKRRTIEKREQEDSDSESDNSSLSSSSSLSAASSTKRRKRTKKLKNKRKNNKDNEKSYSEMDSTSDSNSKSRSSSHSSSVSDLLSDSSSESHSRSKNAKHQPKSSFQTNLENRSSEESSDGNEICGGASKQTLKFSSRSRQQQEVTGGHYSSHNNSVENLSEASCENQNNSEAESSSKHRRRSAGQTRRERKLRKKCAEIEHEIKKIIKKVKLYKKRKLFSNSTKEKARCHTNKKRLLQKKKKFETKLSAYEAMIDSHNNSHRRVKVKQQQLQHRNEDVKVLVSKHMSSNSSETGFNCYESRNLDDYEREHRATHRDGINYPNLATQTSNDHSSSPSGNLAGSVPNLKLPYPVLNDNRDYQVILSVLKDKQVNLNAMLKQTLRTLHNIQDEKEVLANNKEELENRKIRLKNLEENIKVQLTRLSRQIDFINYRIEISKIKISLQKFENQNLKEMDEEKMVRLKRKLNEQTKKMDHLLTLMKDANVRFLKQAKPEKKREEILPDEADSWKNNSEIVNEQRQVGGTNPNSKPTTSALPINYYRSVPPPMTNQLPRDNGNYLARPPMPKNTNTQDKNFNPNSQQLNVSNSQNRHSSNPMNPNHNIQQIVQESTTFNKQIQQGANTSNNKVVVDNKSSSSVSSQPQKSSFQGTNSRPVNSHQKPVEADPAENLTPDSDPKAILAMLNKKYGSKSSDTSANSSQNLSRRTTQPIKSPEQSIKNEPNRFRSPDYPVNSKNGPRNSEFSNKNRLDFEVNPSMLANNFPPSLLNSPAFVSTMTSMLQNMAHQGYNVNAILNQMPNILSGQDLTTDNNNQDYPTNTRSYGQNQFSDTNPRSSNSNQSRRWNQLPNSDAALLPNPTDTQYEDAISKAFCSYLSNYPAENSCGLSADMSLAQINSMLIDSGIVDNFNANYNDMNSNSYNQPNGGDNNNMPNSYNQPNGGDNNNMPNSYNNNQWNNNRSDNNNCNNNWNPAYGGGGDGDGNNSYQNNKNNFKSNFRNRNSGNNYHNNNNNEKNFSKDFNNFKRKRN